MSRKVARVNPRRDKRIFRRTAMKRHKLNFVPNRIGGTCL